MKIIRYWVNINCITLSDKSKYIFSLKGVEFIGTVLKYHENCCSVGVICDGL